MTIASHSAGSMEYKCLQGGSLEDLIPELNQLQSEEDWQVHTCLMNPRGWIQLLLSHTKKMTQREVDNLIQSRLRTVPFPSSTTVSTDPDWLKPGNDGIPS